MRLSIILWKNFWGCWFNFPLGHLIHELLKNCTGILSKNLAKSAKKVAFLPNNIANLYVHLDTFFRQIKSFIGFRLAFVFGLQTYFLIDFSKIYRLKAKQNLMNDLIWRKNTSSSPLTCSKCDLQSLPSARTVTFNLGAALSTSKFQASESVLDTKISDGLAISKSTVVPGIGVYGKKRNQNHSFVHKNTSIITMCFFIQKSSVYLLMLLGLSTNLYNCLEKFILYFPHMDYKQHSYFS